MIDDIAFIYMLTMAVTGFMGCLIVEVTDRESDKMCGFRQKR